MLEDFRVNILKPTTTCRFADCRFADLSSNCTFFIWAKSGESFVGLSFGHWSTKIGKSTTNSDEFQVLSEKYIYSTARCYISMCDRSYLLHLTKENTFFVINIVLVVKGFGSSSNKNPIIIRTFGAI